MGLDPATAIWLVVLLGARKAVSGKGEERRDINDRFEEFNVKPWFSLCTLPRSQRAYIDFQRLLQITLLDELDGARFSR